MDPKPLCQIVTPVGMMGYGLDETLTAYELSRLVPNGVPTAIILDSGSTDSGPEKLALGQTTAPRAAYVKDLTKLLRLVHDFRVPLIFGSAGGDGTNEHVDLMAEIIEEIAAEDENKDYFIKAVSIYSGIDKKVALERLQAGQITGCGTCVPPLTNEEVESSARIVAQIGPEPFIDAMETNPDFNVIIGGRSYDPAPYAAYATVQLKRQHPKLTAAEIQQRYGGFLHMGKIMECGGACSTPKSPGAISLVYEDGTFDIRPFVSTARCTPYSVAAHALYENARPDVLRGPGGSLHLDESKYEQLPDQRTVRVRGAQFRSSRSQGLPYQLKLEAGRVIGYRAMFMGSIKDHILIRKIDSLLPRIRAYVKEQHPDAQGQWDIGFHVYGRDQSTPNGPGEIFIIAEVIAQTQQLATSMAAKARVAMIHGPYPGMKATAGNFAFGIGGKMEIELGQCAKFSVYHLMNLVPGEERLNLPEKTSDYVLTSRLLRSRSFIVGKGQPVAADGEFRAGIARLREMLPVPNQKGAAHVAASEIAKASAAETKPKHLWDIAHVLRSKNAGPFDITIDVLFKSEEIFRAVKKSRFLSAENVARALDIKSTDIVWMGFFEPALGFKVTIPRFRGGEKASAGSFMENDIHGSQKHLGLATMKLPESLRESSGGLLSSEVKTGVIILALGALCMTVAVRSLLVLKVGARMVE